LFEKNPNSVELVIIFNTGSDVYINWALVLAVVV